MKVSKKSMVLAAAFSGLLAGTNSRLNAGVPSVRSNVSVKALAGSTRSAAAPAVADDKDKHGCKGKNSCKGKGGCKAGDNGCKGKNSCQGKGGCATDGSKKSGLAA